MTPDRPDEIHLTRNLSLMLTDEEYALLIEAGARAGLNAITFARKAAIDAARSCVPAEAPPPSSIDRGPFAKGRSE